MSSTKVNPKAKGKAPGQPTPPTASTPPVNPVDPVKPAIEMERVYHPMAIHVVEKVIPTANLNPMIRVREMAKAGLLPSSFYWNQLLRRCEAVCRGYIHDRGAMLDLADRLCRSPHLHAGDGGQYSFSPNGLAAMLSTVVGVTTFFDLLLTEVEPYVAPVGEVPATPAPVQPAVQAPPPVPVTVDEETATTPAPEYDGATWNLVLDPMVGSQLTQVAGDVNYPPEVRAEAKRRVDELTVPPAPVA